LTVADPWKPHTESIPNSASVDRGGERVAASGSGLRSTTPAPGKRRAHSPRHHVLSPQGSQAADVPAEAPGAFITANAFQHSMSTFQENFGKMFQQMAKEVVEDSQKQHEKIQKQVDMQGVALSRVEANHDQLAGQVDEMHGQIARMEVATRELQRELLVARQTAPVPPLRGEGAWDRDPDGTVFRLSAGTTVARAQMERLMEQLVAEAGVPREGADAPRFRCTTKNPFGKSFIFQFEGTPLLAARRVGQVWTSLRDEHNEWKIHHVAAPDGSEVRAYGSLDTPPRQASEERIGKQFANFLQGTATFQKRQVEFHKPKRAILIDWREAARIACPQRDRHELLVNRDALELLKITSKELVALFNQAMREAGIGAAASQVRWESCV